MNYLKNILVIEEWKIPLISFLLRTQIEIYHYFSQITLLHHVMYSCFYTLHKHRIIRY